MPSIDILRGILSLVRDPLDLAVFERKPIERICWRYYVPNSASLRDWEYLCGLMCPDANVGTRHQFWNLD